MSRCMASQSRKIAAVADGLVIEPLLKQVGGMGVCVYIYIICVYIYMYIYIYSDSYSHLDLQ